MQGFALIALTPPGMPHPSIAIAATKAGGWGILDLEYVRDLRSPAAVAALETLARYAMNVYGIKVHSTALLDEEVSALLSGLSKKPPCMLVTCLPSEERHQTVIKEQIAALHSYGITVLWEAISLEEARAGERLLADGIIAKGHESAGRIGEETTFVLLQRFLKHLTVPVYAQGGIGLHTAAACYASGAAGVVLDSQLMLTRESPLPEAVKNRIASMDGSETVCIGPEGGDAYRIYSRPNLPALEELHRLDAELLARKCPESEMRKQWHSTLVNKAGCASLEENLLLIGQDAAFADSLGRQFITVGGVLEGIREAITSHVETAYNLRPLDAGSPSARSLSSRYPVFQGPMARVSDNPHFAAAVADAGGIPFLALSLTAGSELSEILAKTRGLLGDRPWGVGIIGFLPPDLFAEQVRIICQYKPPSALIAGGRPGQNRLLEEAGIKTYLHVPSSGLLKIFLQNGNKRFIFEGRESGGHVGPRTSFVLWQAMIDELLAYIRHASSPASEYHVIFAGGIHDARSAVMVAAMAAPLAHAGVTIGVQMGTAYLFTEELVRTGGITETYQSEAVTCDGTVVLEVGPGHANRCTRSPFAGAFAAEKLRLKNEGRSAEEIQFALDQLSIGRLALAAKGITLENTPGGPRAASCSVAEQRERGMYMIGQAAALKDKVTSVEMLHHEIAEESTSMLDEIYRRLVGAQGTTPGRRDPVSAADIAIIGMASVFPRAGSTQAYWENILNRINTVVEIPGDRWDWKLYYDPDPKAKDKVYSKWGCFIDNVPFDPVKFGMPPNTIRSIEPLQLILLELVERALRDAGYERRSFPRERTSVIVGASGGAGDLGQGYGVRSSLPMLFGDFSSLILSRSDGFLPEWTEDSFAGILMNVAAGRIANRFNLGGENYSVDAACASSLAAVHLAVKELRTYNSDVVIVGAADTMQSPFAYLCFGKTMALSPTGDSRPLDAKADGIVIGEGIAILILKRLEDAERDGDNVYAVIKGVGSSSDGRDKSLTAPRPEGQALALRRAYERARVSPASVELIEAHGTGTVVGDRAEIQALTEVLNEYGAPRQSCAIGSVKSMIGHTKSTAGLAGIIKAALALHHKVLPPTAGVSTPNPSAHCTESPLYINTTARPWIDGGINHPRRAGVSAFGFGGTNFHVVLEEYTGYQGATCSGFPQEEWPSELFIWTGCSRQMLVDTIKALEEQLASLAAESKLALRQLAFTIHEKNKRAAHKAHRSSDSIPHAEAALAIVAGSVDELRNKLLWAREQLSKNTEINDPRGIYFTEHPLAGNQAKGKVVCLFPGQGSQYVNMLIDLFIQFPEVRVCLERANRVFCEPGMVSGKHVFNAVPLSQYIFPRPSFTEDEKRLQEEELKRTNVAQPALGAVSMALFNLLGSLGIRADYVAGHSFGEYVALCAAGVINAADLMLIAEARGRFMIEAAGSHPGKMAAIQADAAAVSRVISIIADVHIASKNSPGQTVITGTEEGVNRALAQCAALNIRARIVPVACAFHSPIVAPAAQQLAAFLTGIALSPPQVGVFSNTTGSRYPDDPRAIAELLKSHLTSPVEFAREIEQLYAAGGRIFVEVGPKSVLTKLTDEILSGKPHLSVASDQPARNGLTQLQHLLGQLAVHGIPLQLDRLYEGRGVKLIDLDKLQEAVRPAFSPTTWLVNGHRARPIADAHKPEQQLLPINLMVAGARETTGTLSDDALRRQNSPPSVPASRMGGSEGHALRAPSLLDREIQMPKDNLPASTAQRQISPAHERSGDAEQVMKRFHQLMNHFLDTQRTVMLTYLRSAHTLPEHAPAVPQGKSGVTVPGTIQHESQQDAERSVPLPEAGEIGSALVSRVMPSAEELTVRLVAIVSERTGYPPDMLDLELDMEADLGIDSIKRIEILGSLHEWYALGGKGGELPSEKVIEELARLKRLREIIDWFKDRAPEVMHSPVMNTGLLEGSAALVSRVMPSAEELRVRLVAIVSERTGYPPDMLDLELDMEADLGIDSIKRIEILGSLHEWYALGGKGGELPSEKVIEELARLKRLREIIEWFQLRAQEAVSLSRQEDGQASSMPADAVASSEPEQEPQAFQSPSQSGRLNDMAAVDGEVNRYTLILEEKTLGRESVVSNSSNRAVLVTDDEGGIARSVAEVLKAQGYAVALVKAGDANRYGGDGSYAVDITSAESVRELLITIRQHQGPIGGFLHLLPLRQGVSLEAMDFAGWHRSLSLEVKSLFYFAKELAEELTEAASSGDAFFMAATGMGGGFAVTSGSNGSFFPGHAGVAGLLKSIAREWSGIRVKVIDLASDAPVETRVNNLMAEIHGDDGAVEVGYTNGSRYVISPRLTPVNKSKPVIFPIDSSWVLLVTGGARGITADIALQLAAAYRPTLLLIGHSPLPGPEEAPETAGLTALHEVKSAIMEKMRRGGQKVEPAQVEAVYTRLLKDREMRDNLGKLKATGAQVQYFQVDVRDEQQFGGFIDEIYKTYGRLDGVIHGAGIIEDKLIKEKTPESFARVFDTKVNSSFILGRKLRAEQLSFLVIFSSVAGRFGNRGQSDYAAANEVSSKLAVYLNKRFSGRVVSTIWGPWSRPRGMVSAELEKQFAQRGIKLVPHTIGPRKLQDELLYGEKCDAEVILAGSGWNRALEEEAGLQGTSKEAREKDTGGETVHLRHIQPGTVSPLINGRDVREQEADGTITLIRKLDVTRDIYLNDHRIDGKPVLPMAMGMELMAEVACAGWKNYELSEINNLKVLQGIILATGPVDVRVTAKPLVDCHDDDDQNAEKPLEIKMCIESVEKPVRTYYRATIVLHKKLPPPPDHTALRLEQVRSFQRSVNDLYRQWLFHGPAFQGIAAIDTIGTNGVIARLNPSSPQDCVAGLTVPGAMPAWIIDPVVIDSALQLIIVWAREHLDMTPLPTGMLRYKRFGSMAGGQVACEADVRTGAVPNLLIGSFAFRGGDGRLVGLMENMEGVCSKALNRLSVKR